MPVGTGTAIAAGVGANLIGGVIGNAASAGDRRRAFQAYQEAQEEIRRVGAPPDLAREILLQKFDQVGALTPELEEAVNLEAPKVAAIKEDPKLREASMTALELLGERAKTGLGVEDKAALQQIRSQLARDAEAKQQQILQSYQQRGLGGAGSELMAKLQAASSGAAQAGEEGLKLQSQAQQAALQAATQYGSLGREIRGQEFDIARTKAAAEDESAMARFREATGRQQRNVAARMDVQRQNLATRQRIAEANVAQANAELQRQRQAEADVYNLKMRRAEALAGAARQMGGAYGQRGEQTAGMWSGIGSSLGQGAMSYGNYAAGQSRFEKEMAMRQKELDAKQKNNYDLGEVDFSSAQTLPASRIPGSRG